MVDLELQDLALHVDGDLLGQVAVGDRGGHLGDVAHLTGQVGRHQVHVVGEVLPGAGDALDVGLTAELAFRADLARDARHFRGEGVELVHHRVDGVLQLQDLAAHVDGDLLGQVAVGDRGGHLGDVAHLTGQVGRHQVHVVGQILPGAGDAPHLRLAAELAFGADLAGDAGHFGGEGVELVHHGVDGVLQLQDLALHVDGDLLGEVAVGHRGGHVGDVAHLTGEVGGHHVHVVGQVLPGAADTFDLGLAAELAFGAHFARDARHLGGEGVELVHHRVDGDFSSRISPFTSTVIFLDRSPLATAVVTSAMLRTWPVRLAAIMLTLSVRSFQTPPTPLTWAWPPSLPSGAHLLGDARHLRGEGVELVHHGVDGDLQLQDLALHVDGDLLGEVAIGDRRGDLGDVAHLTGQVRRHQVHVVGQVLPGARRRP